METLNDRINQGLTQAIRPVVMEKVDSMAIAAAEHLRSTLLDDITNETLGDLEEELQQELGEEFELYGITVPIKDILDPLFPTIRSRFEKLINEELGW